MRMRVRRMRMSSPGRCLWEDESIPIPHEEAPFAPKA